jgi:hypothetical protein
MPKKLNTLPISMTENPIFHPITGADFLQKPFAAVQSGTREPARGHERAGTLWQAPGTIF